MLVALALAAYHSVHNMVDQSKWVSHTYEVLITLDQSLLCVKDAQSSLRGYVLTGDAVYLGAFDVARDKIEGNIQELAVLVDDNPRQQKHVDALNAHIDKAFAWWNNQLTLYHEKGEIAAMASVRLGVGQQLVNEITAQIQEMEASEQRLMAARREASQQALFLTVITGSLALFTYLLILARVFWLIKRETMRREAIENSLQGTLLTMQTINEERRQVAQLSEFLQSCRTPQEIYQLMEQNLPKLFPDTKGAIGLTSNSRNIIETVCSWGEDTGTLVQFPPEDCWAMRRGKIHVVSPHGPDPACVHLTDPSKESVCVPLLAHGETLGVLYIATPVPGYFNEAWMLQLRTVS